ncbi:glycoside hydrolase 5 family protein [Microbacterium gilvum]|uniref:Asl1-like glycosyl hydrolase catalytic domain-containing protein n=1 Tax=Microbacterium gilvum TaxID=1336204 RepID=A0ABP9AAF3_9MICO
MRRLTRLTAAGALLALLTASGCAAERPSALQLLDGVAVYDADAAQVRVATPTDGVTYSLSDAEGGTAASGEAPAHDGVAVIDLSEAGPGYFTLTAEDGTGSLTSSLGIVADLDAAPSPRFGTTAHPSLHEGVDQTAAAVAVGAATVRVDWRWEDAIEAEGRLTPGDDVEAEIARLQARGITPNLVFAYYGECDDGRTPSTPECIQEYVDFVVEAARHYGTGVEYGVYNEFNATTTTSACGTTAACYLEILEPTAAAVRAAVPGAVVTGPALGATDGWWDVGGAARVWFQEFADLGGLALVDRVTVHAYSLTTPPEGKQEAVVQAVREIMAAAGVERPVVMEETGYTTTASGLPEDAQAAFLVRDALLVLAAGAERYMYYNLVDNWDRPEGGEANFGMFRHEDIAQGTLTPKPAGIAHAVLARLVGADSLVAVETTADPDLHVVRIDQPDGSQDRVVWSVERGHVVSAAASTALDMFGSPLSADLDAVEVGGTPVILQDCGPVSLAG